MSAPQLPNACYPGDAGLGIHPPLLPGRSQVTQRSLEAPWPFHPPILGPLIAEGSKENASPAPAQVSRPKIRCLSSLQCFAFGFQGSSQNKRHPNLQMLNPEASWKACLFFCLYLRPISMISPLIFLALKNCY